MKQTKYRLILTALAAVALLATGCSKEPQGEHEGGNSATGKMVSITLPIDIAELETTASGVAVGASRAAAAKSPEDGFSVSFGEPTIAATAANTPATRTIVQELTNVWVLQFNSAGTNVSTTNVGTLAADAYLTAPSLQVGDGYTIYVVANGVASGLTTSNPATLAAFESTMFHTTAVTDATKLPMSGKLTGVSVIDLRNGVGKVSVVNSAPVMVVLTRIHAEVALSVNCLMTEYKLTSAELYNVPIGATYGWNSATTTFPDNTVAANFGYTNTAAAGMASLKSTNSGAETIYKWFFIGDNRRGEVAGLTALNDRHSAKAPAYATFARVTMTHSTTNSKKIYYDIYFGSGTLTNFDVKRNHTYAQSASITGTAYFQEALIDVDYRVSGVGFPVQISLTDSKADSPIVISSKSTESTTSMIWGPTASIPTIQNIFNGKTNTDAMMGISATDYLAAKYCRELGAKYYLPARAELMLMWIYLSAIPSADRPPFDNFWSSTESSSNTGNAWGIIFTSGRTYHNFKSSTNYVRCLMDI